MNWKVLSFIFIASDVKNPFLVPAFSSTLKILVNKLVVKCIKLVFSR